MMETRSAWILTWTAASSLGLALCLLGCSNNTEDTGDNTKPYVFSDTSIERLLRHQMVTMPEPDPTNAVADDDEAARLGQYLFYDTRLSADGQQSCSTCHQPEHGFADPVKVSTAIGVTQRHTPTLVNAAFNRWFYWDGRCDTLWCQATEPLEAPKEHGSTRLEIAHLVFSDAELNEAYTHIFGELPALELSDRFPPRGRPVLDDTRNPDHIAWASMTETDQDQVNEVFTNIAKSIAAYEARLIQSQSPFDRMLAAFESGDASGGNHLSASAKRGAELFVGEGVCWACHAGPAFTNKEFHNVALPESSNIDNESDGRFGGIDLLLVNPFNGRGRYSDSPADAEIKLGYLIQSPEQMGTFKTPGLRNILDTAPYMHGGHFETLTEVVQHYNEMNDPPLSGHREELLLPLFWDDQQVADVVAFLESLQGEPIAPALKEQPDGPL